MTVSLGTGGTSFCQEDGILHRYLQEDLDGYQHHVDCVPYHHHYRYDLDICSLQLINSFFYGHGVVHLHLLQNLVHREVGFQG